MITGVREVSPDVQMQVLRDYLNLVPLLMPEQADFTKPVNYSSPGSLTEQYLRLRLWRDNYRCLVQNDLLIVQDYAR